MRNIKNAPAQHRPAHQFWLRVKRTLNSDAAGGIALLIATVLALIAANTPLKQYYALFIDMPVQVRVGPFAIDKPLLLWINDGLMAVFFFHVGLELKREVLQGELSDLRKVSLPAIGALGGMVVPALIYAAINWDNPIALRGWAIPAATDIAFALGILALLGERVPLALKVFLASLAVFDDVGAIIIIALFYTQQLSLTALAVAGSCLLILYAINRARVMEFAPYLLIGMVMWASVLKSGVHATLAGVTMALFIPLRDPRQPGRSPLQELEHDLRNAVSFGILPLFAFVNSGIDFSGMGLSQVLHPVPVGIAAGLFIGKQVGVFSFCWLGVKLGLARLPARINWASLYGTAILCGIGYTMSMFIGGLAFEKSGSAAYFDERLGIIVGSLISGLIGYAVLRWALNRQPR